LHVINFVDAYYQTVKLQYVHDSVNQAIKTHTMQRVMSELTVHCVTYFLTEPFSELKFGLSTELSQKLKWFCWAFCWVQTSVLCLWICS